MAGRFGRAAAVLALMATGTSCAYMFEGDTTTIDVGAYYDGRAVQVDGEVVGIAPELVEVSRDEDHVVVVRDSNGTLRTYRFESRFDHWGWLLCDIFLTAGIGLIVDGVNGSWYEIFPEGITVQ
jgi:hypothetical protein